jgi:hypothetical protein
LRLLPTKRVTGLSEEVGGWHDNVRSQTLFAPQNPAADVYTRRSRRQHQMAGGRHRRLGSGLQPARMQALSPIVAKSASNERKLCSGSPSSVGPVVCLVTEPITGRR